MIRSTAVGMTAVLAAAALSAPAGAAPAEAAPDDARKNTSLAAVLAADGNKFDRNHRDFDILDATVRAVLAAKPDSPVGLLADGDQRLTAFLPTDRAFMRLSRDLTGKKPKSEKVAFRRIAKVADADTLETILLYHVVPGATLTSPKVLKADGSAVTTAQGSKVRVKVRKSGKIFLGDRDRTARNPQVLPDLLDINRGNRQVAHGINRVLRPFEL